MATMQFLILLQWRRAKNVNTNECFFLYKDIILPTRMPSGNLPQRNVDCGDVSTASDRKASVSSGVGKRRRKTSRKSSFQYAKTALMQRTERMRKKSISKIQPLQDTVEQLEREFPLASPDSRKPKTVSESDTALVDGKQESKK